MSLSDAHYFEEMGVKKYEEIRVLLDTRENKDKIEGMKRLLAMISIGRDASSFFPDVKSPFPLPSPPSALRSPLFPLSSLISPSPLHPSPPLSFSLPFCCCYHRC